MDHADRWMLFADNIGPHLAIDESCLSNGELYTFITNLDRHGHEGCLVAVVAGTKSEDVIQVLKQIDEYVREAADSVLKKEPLVYNTAIREMREEVARWLEENEALFYTGACQFKFF